MVRTPRPVLVPPGGAFWPRYYESAAVPQLTGERVRVELELPAGLRLTPKLVDEYTALASASASQRYRQQIRQRVQGRLTKQRAP